MLAGEEVIGSWRSPLIRAALDSAFRRNGCIALWFFILAFFTTPATAKTWTLDYPQSRVGFVGTQGTDTFEGTFKNFKAVIDFDPAEPETGKITATIDTSSVTAGSKERDDYLPLPDWFDVKKYTQATFASTQIKDATGGCYNAEGTLTIKGVAKPVTLFFCLKKEGDHTRAQGKVTLDRTDFHLGLGEWLSEAYVKHKVDVILDLVAR